LHQAQSIYWKHLETITPSWSFQPAETIENAVFAHKVVKCDIRVLSPRKSSSEELSAFTIIPSTIDPIGALRKYHSFPLIPAFLPSKRQHFPLIFVKW